MTDLSEPDWLPTSDPFDVVLAANILEHLARPERLVREVRNVVRPDGRFIASVPNVAHFKIRVAMARGRFEYQALGILDQTHLPFFTRATLRELLERNGWKVTREGASPGGVKQSLKGRLIRYLAMRRPEFAAFHLIAEATPR